VCDNTRTCRAAGYSAEREELIVSVLLTRRAGASRPVRARVQFAHIDDGAAQPPSPIPMLIDGRTVGTVTLDHRTATGTLTAAQTSELLAAIVKDKEIAWGVGFVTWTLSTTGANAVLLKMDEFQGRLNTPGALIRKGGRPEREVLPPLFLPVIQAVKVPASASASLPTKLKSTLLHDLGRTVNADDCENFDQLASGEAELRLHRLTADRLLVSASCWVAPYNRGETYWIVRDRPPFEPIVVVKDATSYAKGTIIASHKGRGLGDCGSRQKWTWDGQRFIASAGMSTGMCRLIAPGGAWEMPTLTTKLRKPR